MTNVLLLRALNKIKKREQTAETRKETSQRPKTFIKGAQSEIEWINVLIK